MAGFNLDQAIEAGSWKAIAKDNRNRYLEEAWNITQGEIAYVAERLDANKGVELIIGSIRTPQDLVRIANAGPQVITIPTQIVRESEALAQLKEKKRTVRSDHDPLYHPMTRNVLLDFERAADVYRKKI